MNEREFHNNLRILGCIGHHEVPWMDQDQWDRFRTYPYKFCVLCSDDDYARIWAVIEARQPSPKRMIGHPDDLVSRQGTGDSE